MLLEAYFNIDPFTLQRVYDIIDGSREWDYATDSVVLADVVLGDGWEVSVVLYDAPSPYVDTTLYHKASDAYEEVYGWEYTDDPLGLYSVDLPQEKVAVNFVVGSNPFA